MQYTNTITNLRSILPLFEYLLPRIASHRKANFSSRHVVRYHILIVDDFFLVEYHVKSFRSVYVGCFGCTSTFGSASCPLRSSPSTRPNDGCSSGCVCQLRRRRSYRIWRAYPSTTANDGLRLWNAYRSSSCPPGHGKRYCSCYSSIESIRTSSCCVRSTSSTC
jgi:hypothetical protein